MQPLAGARAARSVLVPPPFEGAVSQGAPPFEFEVASFCADDDDFVRWLRADLDVGPPRETLRVPFDPHDSPTLRP